MSILPLHSARFQRLGRLLCYGLLSLLLGMPAASAANCPGKKGMDFPGYNFCYTDAELANADCSEDTLTQMSQQAFEDANGRAQAYADVYSKFGGNATPTEACKMNLEYLIKQVVDNNKKGLLAIFKLNGALGDALVNLGGQQIEREALRKMNDACDDIMKERKNYVDNVQKDGLFVKSVTAGKVSYSPRTAVNPGASGNNNDQSTSCDPSKDPNCAGSGLDSQYQGSYDEAVKDLAQKLASISNNGGKLSAGVYKLCGINFALKEYQGDDNSATVDIHPITVNDKGSLMCSWVRFGPVDDFISWDYYCNTPDGDKKLNNFHQKSNDSAPIAGPTVIALKGGGDGSETSCPLGTRKSWDEKNQAPFMVKKSATAAPAASSTGGLGSLFNLTPKPAPAKPATQPKAPTNTAPAAPANKSGMTY